MTAALRLGLLVALVMTAFAANSVLNRLALAGGGAGPAAFAAVRLLTGAAALAVLLRLRGRALPLAAKGRWKGAGALALYVLGFSFAYVTLDAGVGALILFGGVQITMFAGALIGGERPSPLRWAGAGVAVLGLVWLLWPAGAAVPNAGGAALMAAAALGWGVYSLIGRGATDPLAETAANFVWAAPVGLLAWIVVADAMAPSGVLLAALSGVVTSGLGYALWYAVLPRLAASTAALSQLTVPVIALAGGAVLLGEAVTLRVVLASALVIGGVALGVAATRRR
ncbi:DMT family transporter [Palleronia sp. KMU-117]|uniref:DMT family transporter n=1 Tax=Palleronia sp. KMU-117 TaxID=3434108 RepID=UPI003D713FD3